MLVLINLPKLQIVSICCCCWASPSFVPHMSCTASMSISMVSVSSVKGVGDKRGLELGIFWRLRLRPVEQMSLNCT